ncbi:MAG: hypothetical protein PHX08_15440 [Lachnospiraceae bacterium]|nr:hypothetical protein [Lachnospiraceae bacterium]
MEEHFIRDIQDADMVLVGIGEEFEEKFDLNKMEDNYKNLFQKLEGMKGDLDTQNIPDPRIKDLLNPTKGLLREYLKASYVKSQKNNKTIEVYGLIQKVLENKNYFIVSLCKDGYIQKTDLKKDRMVMPCGNYTFMQCKEKCTDELLNAEPYIDAVIKQMHNKDMEDVILPKCGRCGQNLVFNNVLSNCYNENGYMDCWEVYTKWLQGTLNRRVCILELGVSLLYPTVIRWPFEKVAFLNQKASFYRVNKELYQINEEIAQRGVAISEDAQEYLWKKLSYK